jgi:hypothetical protein
MNRRKRDYNRAIKVLLSGLAYIGLYMFFVSSLAILLGPNQKYGKGV